MLLLLLLLRPPVAHPALLLRLTAAARMQQQQLQPSCFWGLIASLYSTCPTLVQKQAELLLAHE
jgi:hypothetical protein